MNCQYCKRECKNPNSLRNHERLCKQNPNRQTPTWLHARKGQTYSTHLGCVGRPAWNKGLTKETNEVLRRDSEHKKGKPLGPRSEEYKQAQSLRLKRARLEGKDVGGIRHGAGRGKKGYYNGIWCDSTWELAFVAWCIDHNKSISRNKQYYEYLYQGERHKFFPDFLVDGQLVEIKAYISEQAQAKLAQCPEQIELITYGTIEPYLEYAQQKCGSPDITRLYGL